MTVVLPINDRNGASAGIAYRIRFVTRMGTARPAERGSAMSTCVTTVDAGATCAVTTEPKGRSVTAASAARLSTSSRFPSPRTSSDLSVAPAVNTFVMTRSYSTCSRPSLP